MKLRYRKVNLRPPYAYYYIKYNQIQYMYYNSGPKVLGVKKADSKYNYLYSFGIRFKDITNYSSGIKVDIVS